MSDPATFAAVLAQAHELLQRARAGDAVVIDALRALVPRLAPLADADVAATIALDEVQHAVARKLGRDSWAALQAFFESLDPTHAEAARFLKALRDDDTPGALRVLERAPAVARYSIHTAAALAELGTVQALLAAKPALANAPSPGDPVVPLIYAVYEDIKRERGVSTDAHLAVVRALLDAGADPNAAVSLPDGGDAIAALYFPCNANNVAVARLLLERGANPTDGEALYHAAQQGHTECLDLLVEFGADLHRGPSVYGNTPLHFLTTHTPENPIGARAMRGLHWLLAHGSDPSVPSSGKYVSEAQHGETPLHRAAAVGHDVSVLRALVEHGAPVNATRNDGRTAYQLAQRSGHHAAAAYLASVDADTAMRPADALLAACATGQMAEARRLVAQHEGLLEALGPSEREALGLAVTRNDLDTVRAMTELGWPLTHEGEWGGTPLHWAAWNGRTAMVELLLAAGAPVNVRDSRYGSSPIAWCCHGSRFCDQANDVDYPAIAHRLIDAGATRPESFNQWNESPESMARPSVVAVLRARGFVAEP